MRRFHPHSGTVQAQSIIDSIPAYPVPTPAHPTSRSTPDPKVRRDDGLVHAVRMVIVQTTLTETLLVAHACVFVGVGAYALWWLLFVGFGGWCFTARLFVSLVSCVSSYLFMFHAVFVVLLLEFYAMCRLAQYHMAGASRRRPGRGGMVFFWDWAALYRWQRGERLGVGR